MYLFTFLRQKHLLDVFNQSSRFPKESIRDPSFPSLHSSGSLFIPIGVVALLPRSPLYCSISYQSVSHLIAYPPFPSSISTGRFISKQDTFPVYSIIFLISITSPQIAILASE